MHETCFMDDRENWIGHHRTLAVIPNGFPIDALALLLVPTEHRECLKLEDISSALDFGRRFPDFLIFRNGRDAGATRPDHLHFQALLRHERFPIEVVARQPLLAIEDTAVARLDGYPLYGLTVRGPQAVNVAWVILELLHPTPFNLILSGGEVIILPRTKERPEGFGMFGGLEAAGAIVLTDEDRYHALEFDDIQRALAECGFDPGEQQAFESLIREALPHAYRNGLAAST